MNHQGVKFSDEEIGNLEFLNFMEGVYCFKKDDKDQITNYAYITSSCEFLIVSDASLSHYKKYLWDCDNNYANDSKREICKLLGEIAVGIVLLKHGTPYEQKKAKMLWQIYNPQLRAPKKLVSFVDTIKEEEHERE